MKCSSYVGLVSNNCFQFLSKNILIIGGGNIGLNLAKMLETNFEDV